MTKKNTKKAESYRWVFERMEEAFEESFFLECISLCESVISDRLLSYLRSFSKKYSATSTLGVLVTAWLGLSVPRKWKKHSDLGGAVSRWTDQRNWVIHSAAKSNPGSPTMAPDAFQEKAKKVAKKGMKLARDVDRWSQKAKRASK